MLRGRHVLRSARVSRTKSGFSRHIRVSSSQHDWFDFYNGFSLLHTNVKGTRFNPVRVRNDILRAFLTTDLYGLKRGWHVFRHIYYYWRVPLRPRLSVQKRYYCKCTQTKLDFLFTFNQERLQRSIYSNCIKEDNNVRTRPVDRSWTGVNENISVDLAGAHSAFLSLTINRRNEKFYCL